MKIAFLTAGGNAPCLSSSIGKLIQLYSEKIPSSEMIGYIHGYKGLLKGNSIRIDQSIINNAEILYQYGGTPLGNSRIKLTNIDDCIQKGLVKYGEDPLKVAAEQLVKDQIDILHPIGGDDTNTTAGNLVKYLNNNNYDLTVVGLPKTIDNDVYPLKQTLGAWTAAEQGAIFFENIVNENTTSSRQLIIHEIMGRNCGWLTAETTRVYRDRLQDKLFLPQLNLSIDRWDVHAIYLPEMEINISSESNRLKTILDELDCVNIFLCEGAGVDSIVSEMVENGEDVLRDAFGHVRLDEINPGKWFAEQFAQKIGADKVLVQKSGYFSRSAAPNEEDLELIKCSCELAVESAISRKSGVVGLDEENNDILSTIDFDRIKGGKPYDTEVAWFQDLLSEIGQT